MLQSRLSAKTNLRDSLRYPTKLDAQLRCQGVTSDIVISDISSTGAMITGIDNLRVGTAVIVRARALDMFATVVWSSGNAHGLKFRQAVSPLEVVRQNYCGFERFRARRAAVAAT